MNNATLTIEIADWSKLPEAPLVSVYMLAYGHEKFIAQAIDSILAQRCDFPFELIIGDDRSPDATGEIAREYQRRHPAVIRILTAKRNVGALANARRCQLAARGRFIALCEGDDFWHHPEKLQMQVDLLSSHPEMTACHTDYDRMTRFRTKRNRHRTEASPWLAQGDAYVSMLHKWSVMTVTSMFPKWVFDEFRGSIYDNPEWPFGDHNRLLYASLRGSIGYIDVSTATFRKVRGSAGNRGHQAHLRMQMAAEECNSLFLRDYPIDEQTDVGVRALLKRRIYFAAFHASRPDLMREAFAWLRRHERPLNRLVHLCLMTAIATRLPAAAMRATKSLINIRLSAIKP